MEGVQIVCVFKPERFGVDKLLVPSKITCTYLKNCLIDPQGAQDNHRKKHLDMVDIILAIKVSIDLSYLFENSSDYLFKLTFSKRGLLNY